MNIRPLILDETTRARALAVREFAQTNIYRPGLSENIPGDDARHVLNIDHGYRCVFSITEDNKRKLWRHLSISVDGLLYPNPIAAFTIAGDLFGFTGYKTEDAHTPPKSWRMDVNQDEHCVVLIQPYTT